MEIFVVQNTSHGASFWLEPIPARQPECAAGTETASLVRAALGASFACAEKNKNMAAPKAALVLRRFFVGFASFLCFVPVLSLCMFVCAFVLPFFDSYFFKTAASGFTDLVSVCSVRRFSNESGRRGLACPSSPSETETEGCQENHHHCEASCLRRNCERLQKELPHICGPAC